MTNKRASGILLHPSSLPGPGGHGDLGADAYRFVDWLAGAGQRLWQILPLAPPAAGHSPYSALSVLAGNPLLISPQGLVAEGYLTDHELQAALTAFDDEIAVDTAQAPAAATRIDFDHAGRWRMDLLRRAAQRWSDAGGAPDVRDGPPGSTASASACGDAGFPAWFEQQAGWIDDYALFMAIATSGAGSRWTAWPDALRLREPEALVHARRVHADAYRFWLFVQWQFDRQWLALRAHANAQGIAIVGDMPIYCAHDSADVWQHPSLFQLDASGQPARVAGVPPDYFSATGQLWGNPLYAWDVHAADGFAWWRARLHRGLQHADIVRIDHFRGLAGYWSVAADATTAIDGAWEPGPGKAFFDAILPQTDPVPVIAEDLGTITPDVIALRDSVGLPGMAVLQFAFGDGEESAYLPHRLRPETVVYTGTHDNDTTVGWFEAAGVDERERVMRYLHSDGRDIQWAVMQAASASVAYLAIYPMQDVLGLGSDARMNLPGVAGGQWGWRFCWSDVHDGQADRLRAMTQAHDRAA